MNSTTFIYTIRGGKGAWSIYRLPFAIEAFAHLGDDLYIRAGDRVASLSADHPYKAQAPRVIPT